MRSPVPGSVPVPSPVRVRLAHAYAQLLADALGTDLLHLKGRAVDPRLSPEGDPDRRVSTDVDVLVRPAQVAGFVDALQKRSWRIVTGFEQGSAFGHAMNLRHDQLGLLDVHRSWPGFGIDPEQAFEQLWSQRSTQQIGNVSCAVPSLTAQRLILILHAARSGATRNDDIALCWTDAPAPEREAVRALVVAFGAQVPFAAATGGLEQFRGSRDYLIWRHFSRGSANRWQEWHARWAMATGARHKARVARSFVQVNPDLLRDELGREPSTGDRLRAYADRLVAAARDLRSRRDEQP